MNGGSAGMRLVTFDDGSGRARFGVLHGDAVVDPDLALAADRALRGSGRAPGGAAAEPLVARDMVAFFASGAQGRSLAEQALALADDYRQRGDELTAAEDRKSTRL